ncbi:MAG: flavodoxin-dependent (E)-4-hydroxy-3-methylbut-2-enyl-diphosphate synthase, partial [Fenollaria timonensis]
MIIRKKTKKIFVGNVAIGGDAPITIQSMTNTDTKDVEATVKQVIEMENHGLDIIRMAVNEEEDAKAIN